jgi:hypothetical protein
VVDVVQEDVDRLDPLDAASLDEIPFGAVEDTGDQVERDQPLGRSPFGIDGKGDAEPAKQFLGCILFGDEGVDRKVVEEAGKLGVAGRTVPSGARISSKNLGGGREDGDAVSSTLTRSALCGKPPVLVCKNDPVPKLGALPVFYFSGILIRCRSLEQRPSGRRRS